MLFPFEFVAQDVTFTATDTVFQKCSIELLGSSDGATWTSVWEGMLQNDNAEGQPYMNGFFGRYFATELIEAQGVTKEWPYWRIAFGNPEPPFTRCPEMATIELTGGHSFLSGNSAGWHYTELYLPALPADARQQASFSYWRNLQGLGAASDSVYLDDLQLRTAAEAHPWQDGAPADWVVRDWVWSSECPNGASPCQSSRPIPMGRQGPGSASMSLHVPGPTTLSFQWRCLAHTDTKLELYVGGSKEADINGDTGGWLPLNTGLNAQKSYHVEFRFSKAGARSLRDTCWLYGASPALPVTSTPTPPPLPDQCTTENIR